ncbi:MAG: hypothetical protein LQ350_008235 [Teloschistes chrysophthalmus]|nr:MAG: hypothetical protein LQ350_008235 [Niorma chrysophthalma]
MYIKFAALLIGAMAALVSTSPVAPAAEAGTVLIARDANSTAPGLYHKLVSGPKILAAAAITHLYVCIDINFGGRCENLESTKQGCCELYPHRTMRCSGASLGGIVNPGIRDLRNFNFNDRASSYQCN